MLFNSFEFLIFFLIFIIPYYLLYGTRYQRYFFLLMSLVFYGYWHPPYLLILLASILIDFFAAKAIFNADSLSKRKIFLVVSLVLNLGMLSYFKYADFIRESINQALLYFNIHWQMVNKPFGIVLPIGISFYTFQSLSYTIDVYRGDTKPCRKLSDFALYITFFPQLIAGPILRFSEFEPFRQKPWAKASTAEAVHGAVYIAFGLFKKVIISDNIAWWIDKLFANINIETSPILIVIGMILFGIQIYADFSGYSDIAIGLGRLCGIKLPDNFNNPYFALNITDFWKRWHITFSRWLRDYLYIPLGGNRKGKGRRYLNLMMTMLLGGLWHGASWNFAIWGGLHGIGLTIHKWYQNSFLRKNLSKIPTYKFWMWLVTMIFIFLTWLVFRINTAQDLTVTFQALLQVDKWIDFSLLRNSQIKKLIPFVFLFLLNELIMRFYTKEQIAHKAVRAPAIVLCLICFIYGVIFAALLPGGREPFIYFQF